MKKIVFEQSQYFLNCDYINKCLIGDLNKIPKLEKINIYFSLDKFINCLYSEKLSHIEALYLIYSNFMILPIFKFKSINSKKKTNSKTSCTVFLTLKNKSQINLFLFQSIYNSKKFRNIIFSKLNKQFRFNKSITLQGKLPLELLNSSVNLSSDFLININFVIKNLPEFKSSYRVLQNMFFF